MTKNELQEKIDELGPWHFNHLLNGISTGDSQIETTHPKIIELLKAGTFSRKIYPQVLDLGANSGIISEWFVRNKQSHVDAIEFHPKYFPQLELVIEVKGLSNQIKAIKKDLHEGDFGENKYDLVLFLGTMHHLVKDNGVRLRILNDCRRALIPGGEIVVQTESSLPIAEMMKDAGFLGVEKLPTNWSDRSAWFGFKDPMKLWTENF